MLVLKLFSLPCFDWNKNWDKFGFNHFFHYDFKSILTYRELQNCNLNWKNLKIVKFIWNMPPKKSGASGGAASSSGGSEAKDKKGGTSVKVSP